VTAPQDLLDRAKACLEGKSRSYVDDARDFAIATIALASELRAARATLAASYVAAKARRFTCGHGACRERAEARFSAMSAGEETALCEQHADEYMNQGIEVVCYVEG
jgi:hypothetical protein